MHKPQYEPAQRAGQRQPEGAMQSDLPERAAFIDRRPGAVQAHHVQRMADDAPRAARAGALQAVMHHGARARQANSMGLPDPLKAGIEALSGMNMDHVRVHYNSAKPAQLRAHAYAEGNEIHLATGQEQHLAHEAWHVVQQARGRVPATAQVNGGVPVNDDPALEREADIMGARALAANPGNAPAGPALTTGGGMAVKQKFDWMHNKRKVGVEITEDDSGENTISVAAPNASWAGVADKNAQWPHTINLPGPGGGAQTWHVGTHDTLGAYFDLSGSKSRWMRWGNVTLTEDYGDYEWIVAHPDTVMGVSEYRNRLNAAQSSRAAFRTALAGMGSNDLLVSLSPDPAAGQVFYAGLGATQQVSSQVTFELTDQTKTLDALVAGVSYGLDRPRNESRTAPPVADPAVTDLMNRAINRVPVAGTNMALVVAYLMADMAHKIATLIDGAGWSAAISANFKDWRILFPKSHPFYITRMAIEGNVDAVKVALVAATLNGQKVQIMHDVAEMFARMIQKKGPRIMWSREADGQPGTAGYIPRSVLVDETSHEYDRLMNEFVAGGTGANTGARTTDLETLLTTHANPTFLGDEFDNAVAALTDSTKVQQNVVRSSSFSQHAPDARAFTFEDRAEVPDSFPDLTETYARVVEMVDRY